MMSPFINATGGLKTYAIIDAKLQCLIETGDWCGATARRKEELERAGVPDLTMVNLTDSHCPLWLKQMMHADRAYCERMVARYQSEAQKLLRQAAELTAQAQEREKDQRMWQTRAEDAR